MSVPLEGLSIQIPDILYAGQIITAIASLIPSNATLSSSISWFSSDINVATVDLNTGLITVKANPPDTSFILSVSGDDYSATVLITVLPNLKSIALKNTFPEFSYPGYTIPILDYLILTWSDNSQGLTNGPSIPTFTYTSQNTVIVPVDSSGNIFASRLCVSPKTITINVSGGSSSFTTTALIQVIDLPYLSGTGTNTGVTSASIYLGDVYVGKNTQAYIVIEPFDSQVNIVWSITSTVPDVAYIDPLTGIVTGLSGGSFIIIAEVDDTQNNRITTSLQNLTCISLITSMILLPTSIMGLQTGEANAYTSTLSSSLSIYPSDATDNKPAWTSSNPGVSTVLADYITDSLTITGVSNGTTTITVQSSDLNRASASMIVMVQNGLTAITTNLPSDILIGKSFQGVVTPVANGSYSGIQWSSDDQGILNVSNTGRITGVSSGTANIIIIAGGQAGFASTYTFAVTVTQPVSSIIVSPVNLYLSLPYNDDPDVFDIPGNRIFPVTQQINTQVLPDSAANQSLQWTSFDTLNPSISTIASVDNLGNITALSIGDSTVQVRALDGSEVFATIYVNVGVPMHDIELIFPNNNYTLNIGEPIQIIAKIKPYTATTNYRLWNVSASEITAPNTTGYIQVTDQGVIIPMQPTAEGSPVTFTVSATNHYTSEIITVTSPPITVISKIKGLSIIPGYVNTSINKQFTLSPYIFPSVATNKGIIWNSLSKNVATIDSSGNVTTVGPGVARITAKTTDGTNLQATSYIYCSSKAFSLVQTLAGSISGNQDGFRTNAKFNDPHGITIDTSGNYYITDTTNNSIRLMDPSYNVTTLASVERPSGIVIDSQGNLFITSNKNVIYKIAPGESPVIFAGGYETPGFQDGEGIDARFRGPSGITIDSMDNLYVADTINYCIRRITPEGLVTTFAGSLTQVSGSNDGIGSAARFNLPFALDMDNSGNIYVADTFNSVIRKIAPNRQVTTVAGIVGSVRVFQPVDAQGSNARFSFIRSISIDKTTGNIYVADDYTIRIIDINYKVTTFCGSSPGYIDGLLESALFNYVLSLKADGFGNIFMTDTNLIRGVLIFESAPTPFENLEVLGVSSCDFTAGWTGTYSTISYSYLFSEVPLQLVSIIPFVDNGINYTNVCINGLSPATQYRLQIRARNPNGTISSSILNVITLADNSVSMIATTFAGSILGYKDGQGTTVQFSYLKCIKYNPSLRVFYVIDQADSGNAAIRKITANGLSSLIAGSSTAPPGFLNAQGANASFNNPAALTFDKFNNIYIADIGNNAIRKIDSSGNVTTYATLYYPLSIACDKNNNVYVAASETESGTYSNIYIIDVFGNTSIYFTMPNRGAYTIIQKIAFDLNGNILMYVNDAIYCVYPDKTFSLIAGSTNGYIDGQGSDAAFNGISDIMVDLLGNIYVSDRENNAIRKIDSTGNVTTLNTQTNPGFANGLISQARFNTPVSVTVDSFNSLYIVDLFNFRIREVNLVTSTPGAIENLASSSITTSGFSLSWSGAANVTQYEYTLDSGSGPIAIIPTIDNGTFSQTATFTGLSPWTIYTVSLKASNKFGSTTQSISVYTQSPPIYLFPMIQSSTMDNQGNLYIVIFSATPSIVKIDTSANITTFAGPAIYNPTVIKTLSGPSGIAIDTSNNKYIVEASARKITKIDSSGNITTFAGTGASGNTGDGGLAINAAMTPVYIEKDENNFYLTCGTSIRKIDSLGIITTIIKYNTKDVNSIDYSNIFPYYVKKGGANPYFHMVDISGNIRGNNIAENSYNFDSSGNMYGTVVDNDGNIINLTSVPALSVFYLLNNRVSGITVDINSNVYFCYNAFLYKIDSSGMLSVIGYGNTFKEGESPLGYLGMYSSSSGTSSQVLLKYDNNNIYLSGGVPHKIIRIDLTTNKLRGIQGSDALAKVYTSGADEMSVSATRVRIATSFSNSVPPCPTVYNGAVYITDNLQGNMFVRKIDPSTQIMKRIFGEQEIFILYKTPNTFTIIWKPVIFPIVTGYRVSISGRGFVSALSLSREVTVTGLLPNTTYSASVITYYQYIPGPTIGQKQSIPLTIKTLIPLVYYPQGMAFDSQGNLFVAMPETNRVCKIDTAGNLTTYAGNGTAGYSKNHENIKATGASLNKPRSVAVDTQGNLYIADTDNSRIRKVDTYGYITTYAGGGSIFYSGQQTSAINASLSYPQGVSVDLSGNVYIADTFNQVISMVNSLGIISIIAGTYNTVYNATQGYVDGPALEGQLNTPVHAVVDALGNLYISDLGNQLIRQVYYDAESSTSMLRTFVGSNDFAYVPGVEPISALIAKLYNPYQLAIDNVNNFLYIADSGDNIICKLDITDGTPGGNITSVTTSIPLNNPQGIAIDSLGNLFISDTNSHQIRKVDTAGETTTLPLDSFGI